MTHIRLKGGVMRKTLFLKIKAKTISVLIPIFKADNKLFFKLECL